MELIHWLSVAWAIITAVVGWIVTSFSTLTKSVDDIKVALAKAEVKIEACWSFMADNHRYFLAKEGKYGQINSPFEITDTTRELFRKYGLDQKLKDYYTATHQHKSQVELEMDIQNVFRPILAETVCKDTGWTDGQCIVLAAALTKELCDSQAA